MPRDKNKMRDCINMLKVILIIFEGIWQTKVLCYQHLDWSEAGTGFLTTSSVTPGFSWQLCDPTDFLSNQAKNKPKGYTHTST